MGFIGFDYNIEFCRVIKKGFKGVERHFFPKVVDIVWTFFLIDILLNFSIL